MFKFSKGSRSSRRSRSEIRRKTQLEIELQQDYNAESKFDGDQDIRARLAGALDGALEKGNGLCA